MTAQITDTMVYEGAQYCILGGSGIELFRPKEHGIVPVPRSTACWRGFACRYSIQQGQFLLDILRVYIEKAPTLFGVTPRRGRRPYHFDAVYEGLAYKTPFTGTLFLTRGFIDYFHWQLCYASNTEEVLELRFDEGSLVSAKDHSEEMKDPGRREKLTRQILGTFASIFWYTEEKGRFRIPNI